MEILKNPIEFLKTLKIVGWAEKSIILLVMQTCDSSFQMRLKRSWWCPWKKSLKSVGKRVPPFIEPANRFAEKMTQRFQGKPLTALTEIFSMFLPQPTFWEDQSWERAVLREWLIRRTEFFTTGRCMSAMAVWLEPTLEWIPAWPSRRFRKGRWVMFPQKLKILIFPEIWNCLANI